MVDEKDRFGDKLKAKEKAEEDRYFKERDRVALERLRQEKAAAGEQQAQAHMRCPKDGATLVPVKEHDITVEECPTCQGMWVDKGELQTLASRERDSWLGRFFYRPRL